MTMLATALRATHVADFYMTKYLSKAQAALGPAMQPCIAIMRRISDAESALEPATAPIASSAGGSECAGSSSVPSSTRWLSGCELGRFRGNK